MRISCEVKREVDSRKLFWSDSDADASPEQQQRFMLVFDGFSVDSDVQN